jgi:hypothetical protein
MEIIWGIHSLTFLWRMWPGPWFHHQAHIHDSCLKYVLHMTCGLLDLVYEMCSVNLIFLCFVGRNSIMGMVTCYGPS